MGSSMLHKYSNKNKKAKVIALSIKALTAVFGTAAVLEENHPYITLCILGIGAVANEVINFYKWEE
jgi:hypothetical protein